MEKNKCIDCDKEISWGAKRCLSCSASENNRGRTGSKNAHWKGGKIICRCAICNTEFYVKPSRLKSGRGIYCSVTCRRIAQAKAISGENHPRWVGKILTVCKQCGCEFEAYQSALDAGYSQFCSNVCRGAWVTENLSGENSPAWQGRTLEQECLSCGKRFMAPACVVENGLGKFCSHDCYGAYYSGERRPQWQGGISFEPYPPTFNEAFKRIIRERDGHKCAICGLPGKAVHHINYVKDDTNLENCITLCKRCHSKTNHHRAYWQAELTVLVGAQNGRG